MPGQQAALSSGYTGAFELPAAICLLALAASLAVPEVRRPRTDYESHAIGFDRNELGALLVAAGLG
jgi:hypothetical protein